MLTLSNISRRLIIKQLPVLSQCSLILNMSPPSTVITADYSLHHFDNRLCSLSNKLPTDFTSKRYKSKKKKEKQQEDDEDSDAEGDNASEWKNEDPTLDKDSKVAVVKCASMRADTVIKSAFGIARNKIENLFYENKIRKNGRKLAKKSATISIGDEIDVIRGFNSVNSKNLNIARFELLDTLEKKDGIAVTMRIYKSLVIENYEEAPFELGDTNPDA